MLWLIRAAKLPTPETQAQVIPGRRHRFDFAWRDQRLLLEVQGGVWTGGKHGRGSGIIKDQEKLNLAAINGWRVLQVSANHIRDGKALLWIQQALGLTPPENIPF